MLTHTHIHTQNVREKLNNESRLTKQFIAQAYMVLSLVNRMHGGTCIVFHWEPQVFINKVICYDEVLFL